MKQQTLFIKFKRNPNLMNLKSSTHLFKIKYHLQSSYDSQKCLSTINFFISINWKQQIVLIKFKGELNHINLKSSTHLFKINYHLQTSYDSQNCLSTTKKNYNKGSFNNYVDKKGGGREVCKKSTLVHPGGRGVSGQNLKKKV